MANVRPFAAIRYSRSRFGELSNLVAPPYDVLDEKGKGELQGRHENNIVTVDLPHLPPKELGPVATYVSAAGVLKGWMGAGVLERDSRPALYPYLQTYEHAGHAYHRRGFFGLVKLTAFGQGPVVPHEKTYASAIADRLELTRATEMQLSPIFGLFGDPRNEVTGKLFRDLGKPEQTATLNGVKNDLWSVTDSGVENEVIDLMKHKNVYIADGHHRYTMALQYQKEREEKNGGPLPVGHPANWCLFVLVGMQDAGLLILPTHRLIGGLANFTVEAFRAAVGENFDVFESPSSPAHFGELTGGVSHKQPQHVFGLYVGATKRLFLLRLKNQDVLKNLEPTKSEAWRKLDVAILQRYLIEEVLAPKFGGGKEPAKGYTADAGTIEGSVDGVKYQVALLLPATPLGALEELGKHGEVMPQKSTYFFPKLITGMVINPVG